MVDITDVVCLLVPLALLAGSSVQTDVRSVKEADKTGNFMEDDQWLSTISQYSRKLKHWNRFRDVSPLMLLLLLMMVVVMMMERCASLSICSDSSVRMQEYRKHKACFCCPEADDDVHTWDENQGSNDRDATGSTTYGHFLLLPPFPPRLLLSSRSRVERLNVRGPLLDSVLN
ncbi:unnamed protein product [Pleuronectes platessa]|uniref:Uncharacterized protein n=1 Tax=Pleuronectes platessa TaxID=8262 RepID=A0A9N7UZ61_PLEPL|nr:unnamed protein product [Pleuronectes platessa]